MDTVGKRTYKADPKDVVKWKIYGKKKKHSNKNTPKESGNKQK